MLLYVRYNLHPHGPGDLRTVHAACPVMHGSKWGEIQGVTSTVLTISAQWGTGGSERGGRYTGGTVGGGYEIHTKHNTLVEWTTLQIWWKILHRKSIRNYLRNLCNAVKEK